MNTWKISAKPPLPWYLVVCFPNPWRCITYPLLILKFILIIIISYFILIIIHYSICLIIRNNNNNNCIYNNHNPMSKQQKHYKQKKNNKQIVIIPQQDQTFPCLKFKLNMCNIPSYKPQPILITFLYNIYIKRNIK